MKHYVASLRIRHRQADGGDVLSYGELAARAWLSPVPEGWNLHYEEPPGEGETSGTRVAVGLLNSGAVFLQRFGEVCSSGWFRAGVESAMRYNLQGQELRLTVRPDNVAWKIDPPKGSVHLAYGLWFQPGESVRHTVKIDIVDMHPAHPPIEGIGLKAWANRLLCVALEENAFFLRWANPEKALLVTDASRTAQRAGLSPQDVLKRLNDAGWHVREERGLWWLDAPDGAYRQALLARGQTHMGNMPHVPPVAEGEALPALCALCATLLAQPPVSGGIEIEIEDWLRPLLRGAWRATEGDIPGALAWAQACAPQWAAHMRYGNHAGQHACGVLLQRFLCRFGVDVAAAGSL